jgi:tRNA-Thr(GGU) m(6)t(6)A37 methyltransferase TsaA
MDQEISISPIGYVRVKETGTYLELVPECKSALQGLDGFSHVNVFWWGHLYATDEYRAIVECDQPYKHAPKKLGIFATRSPVRPNPIALTAVPIIKIDHEQGRIQVAFIDAENETPILDLKPYHPAVDRIREASVPAWCKHWPQWYEDSADFDWESEFMFAQK